MTQFISHVHAELRRARLLRRGSTQRPEEVPIGLHKSYDRMEKIALPQASYLETSLSAALQARTSYSGGNADRNLSLREWGTLLGLALGKRSESHSRNYPSGGALFPTETYIVARHHEDTFAAFHYSPTLHALEKLWDLPRGFDIKQLVRKPEDLFFSSLIIFTSCWRRSSAKYGDFTYLVALLEAGHISENILLVATALQLQSRPMAGFDDEKIIDLLDLDSEYEQPVHTIVLSVAATSQ